MRVYISPEDMKVLRRIANDNEVSVSELGVFLARSLSSDKGIAVRLSDDEYGYIYSKSMETGMSMSRFCSLACRSFLNVSEGVKIESLYCDNHSSSLRKKRIEVKLISNNDMFRVESLSYQYGIKVSTLIRYCSLRFDGSHFDAGKDYRDG
ncbi:MAG: hypothetical protein PHI19_00035 [Clostridia bacterium]|jgi:hypothetical protein|nr:hypothetical protein [Clostridia bacterium]